MCAPSETNFQCEDKEKQVRIKALDDGRFRVKFIRQQLHKNSFIKKSSLFDCGFIKSETNNNDGLENNNDTTSVWSTKAGTVKGTLISPSRSNLTTQSRSSVLVDKRRVCDDWESLNDNYGWIRAIGIYTTYYVKGIKIIFETDDMKTITTLHSSKNFDPEQDPKVSYKELKLQEGEVVERFSWVKSTQTNFIRSITLCTNYDRNLCVEGEIEVHDILKLEPEKRPKFDNEAGYDSGNYESNTFIWEEPDDIHSAIFKKKPSVFRSILLEGDNEIYDLDRLELRKQSVAEQNIKTHFVNLRSIHHYLVGLRTLFRNEYLEDVELYTEQNEDIKVNMADN